MSARKPSHFIKESVLSLVATRSDLTQQNNYVEEHLEKIRKITKEEYKSRHREPQNLFTKAPKDFYSLPAKVREILSNREIRQLSPTQLAALV